MASMLNNAKPISTPTTVEQIEVEGIRFVRYCALEEIVGLVFGALTAVYIVLSVGGQARCYVEKHRSQERRGLEHSDAREVEQQKP